MNFIRLLPFVFLLGCGGVKYSKTVDNVDIQRFMGDWYVIAGRTTFLEKGATNSLEQYSWNEEKNRIDITFTYNKNTFDGPLKTIEQKAWIHNSKTNAHWKVQPLWPFKLDYLVIALDKDYQWTVVGVPNQAYLWLMARVKSMSEEKIKSILKDVAATGYSIEDVKPIRHGN